MKIHHIEHMISIFFYIPVKHNRIAYINTIFKNMKAKVKIMMIMSIMMKESFLQTQATVSSFIAQKLNPAE